MTDVIEGMELLDENEMGEKLYRLENDIFDTVVLVEPDETAMVLDDMQGAYPETLEECSEYGWNNAEDVEW